MSPSPLPSHAQEFVNKKFSNESILSQIEDEEQMDRYDEWLKKIQNCVQFDKWGQVVEAVEAYQGERDTVRMTVSDLHDLVSSQYNTIHYNKILFSALYSILEQPWSACSRFGWSSRQ